MWTTFSASTSRASISCSPTAACATSTTTSTRWSGKRSARATAASPMGPWTIEPMNTTTASGRPWGRAAALGICLAFLGVALAWWAWSPGGAARLTLRGHAGPVWAVAFARDGSLLATAGEDGSVRFWDPQNGTSRGVFSLPSVKFHAVAICPTQPLVAVGGEDKIVRLIDPAGPSEVAALTGHTDAVTC